MMHHGIKGQKWGIRRYQRKDGTLTPLGRRRISKEYKALSDQASKEYEEYDRNNARRAHNEANDYMSKKYGKNWADKNESFYEIYREVSGKKYADAREEFFKNNASYRKSKELIDKYKMTSWNELARQNEDMVKAFTRPRVYSFNIDDDK